MSKGLEMLEILKQRNDTLKINHKIGSRDIANQEIKEITQCFDNYVIPVIEKELKALEIVNKKRVNVHKFKWCVFKKYSVNYYNLNFCDEDDQFLNEQEFGLLKEVIENDK